MKSLAGYVDIWWSALFDPMRAGRLVLVGEPGFARFLALTVAVLYAVYGLSMGLFHSPFSALVSALKLPLLFLLSLGVCLPALYALNCVYGGRLSLVTCLRLLLLAISANAAALASYAPFSLFFTLTTSSRGYPFIVMMHVVVFAVSGLLSLAAIAVLFRSTAAALGRPFRPLFLSGWSLLYIFVGTQMSWVLKPWVGNPDQDYAIIRLPLGGTFIEAVWDLTINILRHL